ncbi:MAG TPA: bifunctional phosphopantothenoylcysteine decarboxylase/phosphopantothenate--cysteine ligase CoaBC [Gemmatimonadaceae bacterium]|nr:bifunctional phosphopantothenoylcysteine decarboxylase/phosphopantothenate--cysteine ligase CoaBC [Gemmatimonadaceae bacterium]
MRPFDGRRVLLGVTGGIASYKTVMLARLLTQAGAEVDVVMTRSALEFVGAITFEAVTGRRTYSEIFGAGNALDHIHLAQSADVFVVAPATADFLARAAHGLADDLLSAALLANQSPVLLVPAMNDRMWANMQTAKNVESLRERGYTVLDPDTGPLAAGEGSGPGRMPEPDAIFSHVARILDSDERLAGKRIVVTAGATREAVDPVRFISNHSTGKMGIAIAEAAWRRGADVTLVVGHVDVPVATGPRVVRTESVDEMAAAVASALPQADALVMAAAPADFRPAQRRDQKISKRADSSMSIELAPTVDILKSTMSARRDGAVIVGFALETGDAIDKGNAKLKEKSLDMIVVNDALEEGAGFGVDTNRVTILSRDRDAESLPLMSKAAVADAILDRVGPMMDGR